MPSALVVLRALSLALAVALIAPATGVLDDRVAAASPNCVRIIAGRFVGGADSERLKLKNVCTSSVSIGGWSVHDVGALDSYRFSSVLTLAGRSSLTLYSRIGTDGPRARYWGRTAGAWGEGPPERAHLRDAQGSLVASWSPYVDRTLVGAGDVAECGNDGDERTAGILDKVPGWVFVVGDAVYLNGTASEFAECYDPSWGRHKARTRPAVGNHEYHTDRGGPYYSYFGSQAGPAGQGWYSYELGAWHIVVLNSICWFSAIGCTVDSPQGRWLEADLAAHPADCILAYWHHPLFSSGYHGSDPTTKPFWETLRRYGAEVVIAGHDHNYERFTPMTPEGVPDATSGIRQFIVGTGGKGGADVLTDPLPTSEAQGDKLGVLRLDLRPRSYGWEFLGLPDRWGRTFSDSGSGRCH